MPHAFRLSITLCFWGLLWGAAWELPAQDAAVMRDTAAGSNSAQEATRLQFRRIYYPEGREVDLPFDNQRYPPVEAEVFERLAEQLATSQGRKTTAGPRIQAAEYIARLSAPDTLTGTARWKIALDGSEPMLLTLAPWLGAVHQARWEQPAGEPDRPVVLGNFPDGQWMVLVDKPGDLIVDWSLRGTFDSNKAATFAWESPACPLAALHLTLPSGSEITTNDAMVLPVAAAQDAAQADTSTWQVHWASGQAIRLRIAAEPAAIQAARLPAVRQELQYDLTPGGLRLTSTLHLDALESANAGLALELPSELQLVRAQLGDQAMVWSSPETTEDGLQRVVLQLPTPTAGTPQGIQLFMAAPLKLGQLWNLPAPRLPDTYWEQGTALVLIRKPLVLDGLQLENARQTSIDLAEGANRGKLISFQLTDPAARLGVTLGQQPRQLLTQSVSAVSVRPKAFHAELYTEAKLQEGELFNLKASLVPGWRIDSVVTEPASLLREWSIRENEGRPNDLHIQLTQPLRFSTPLRMRIQASRAWEDAEPVTIDLFDFLELQDALSGKHLVRLSVAPPLVLESTAGRANAPVEGDFSPWLMDALNQVANDPVFELTHEGPGTALVISSPRSQYAAETAVGVAVQDDQLAWQAHVWLEPISGGPTERVRIFWSGPGQPPRVWQLQDHLEKAVPAATLPHAQAALSKEIGSEPPTTQEAAIIETSEAGSLLELRLPAVLGARWKLTAQTSLPASVSLACPLISIPEAARQSATVTLFAPPDSQISAEPNRLSPLGDATQMLAEPGMPVRGCWQYDPVLDTNRPGVPALLLGQKRTGMPLRRQWCKSVVSHTFVRSGSAPRELVSLWLVNHGQPDLSVILPKGAVARSASASGKPITWRQIADRVTLSLDKQVLESRLVVSFDRRPLANAWEQSLDPVLIPEMPVMESQWHIWTPPDVICLDEDEAAGADPWWQVRWRLFGPLARGQHRSAFGLLGPKGWLPPALHWAGAASDQATAQDLLEALGTRLLDWQKTPSSQHTYREWLSALERLDNVWVNASALHASGINAYDFVPTGSQKMAGDAAKTALAESGLCLLLVEGGVVVTHTSDLAGRSEEWLPISGTQVLAWRPAANSVLATAGAAKTWQWLPVESWYELDPLALDPIGIAGSPSDQATLPWGWQRLEQRAFGQPARLCLVSQAELETGRYGLLLASAGLIGWLGVRRWRWSLLLWVSSMAAALLVPAPWSAWVPSLVLGQAAGLLYCALRPVISPKRTAKTAERSSALSGRLVQASAVGLACWLLPCLFAQQPPAGKAKPPAVYHVFIPVDENRQLAGGFYYVPETLYEEMLRLAREHHADQAGWLIENAQHETTVGWDAARQRLVPSQLKTTLSLQILDENGRLRLPLGKVASYLLEGSLRLDGQPVFPAWESDEETLLLDDLVMGRHELTFITQALPRLPDRPMGFEFPLLPISNSLVTLHLPPDAPALAISSAKGAVARAENPPRQIAQVGAASRLVVQVEDNAMTNQTGPVVDVDEYLWLKIQPGNVTLDTRLLFHVRQGTLQEIVLAAEERLRPLPMPRRDPRLGTPVTQPGNPPQLRFPLTQPVTDDFVLDWPTMLVDTLGFGHLRMPQVKALGVRNRRRMLAVSVHPDIRYQVQTEGAQEVPIDEFARAWGTAGTLPVAAYLVPQPETLWSVHTQPAAAKLTAVQTQLVDVSLTAARLQLEAQVQVLQGQVFAHRVQVPAGFKVARIAALDGESSLLESYSQAATDTVWIFLSQAAPAKHRLVVEGSLPILSETLPLPLLQLAGTDNPARTVAISRQDGVLVDVQDVRGLVEAPLTPAAVPPDFGPRLSSLGRPVVQYTAADQTASATLRVTANLPNVQGTQVSRLDYLPEKGEWQLVADCRVVPQNGVLDSLQFEVDPLITGLELQAGFKAQLSQTASGTRSLVTLRPEATIRSPARFSLRGTWRPAAGAGLQVPQIRMIGLSELSQFLDLPLTAGRERITWETQALQPEQLPQEMRSTGEASGSRSTYRVLVDHFAANSHLAPGVADLPRIPLAEIVLAANSDGTFRGLACLDIVPGNMTECVVSLPLGGVLEAAYWENEPALVSAQGARQATIRLRSASLPRRLTLLYRGVWPAEERSASWQLAVPTLSEIPIQRLFCRLDLPPGYAAQSPPVTKPFDRAAHALAQLESQAQMLQACVAKSEHTTDAELAPWLLRFQDLVSATDRQVQASLGEEGANQAVRHDWHAAREASWNMLQSSAAQLLADSPAQGWQDQRAEKGLAKWQPRPVSWEQPFAANLGQGPGFRLQFEVGQPATLFVPIVNQQSQALRLRHWLAIAIVLLAAVFAANRFSFVAASVVRWPRVVGVIAGMGYWLFLQPSLLGWVIMGVSLFAGHRTGWHLPWVPDEDRRPDTAIQDAGG